MAPPVMLGSPYTVDSHRRSRPCGRLLALDVDAVSRLLSLTSHELRSPLGVIRGYLKLLEQHPGSLTDPQKLAVAASLRATTRMMEILAEISAFAQLQRGDTSINRQPTTLTALSDAAMGTGLTSPSSDAVPEGNVLADMSLLGPALASVTAAVQASRPRETTVPISIRVEEGEAGRFARIVVGQQPAAAVTVSAVPIEILRGGLGLRLPLASIVVDAHGGQIEELQQDGRMVAMLVRLPLVPASRS
jgi:K+-sensing histidine kinase KdpD